MQTATFTMYAFAANTTGNLDQMANVREWLPQGSRSVSDWRIWVTPPQA